MTNTDSQRARFGIKFSMLARQWRRVMQAHLASIGLTDTTWVPLIQIHECGGGITLKELAFRVGVDSSSLVRIIDKLEREELIVRQRDEADGRAKLIYLTGKGSERVAEIRLELNRFEAQLLADVDEHELTVMTNALNRIQKKLDDYENPPQLNEK